MFTDGEAQATQICLVRFKAIWSYLSDANYLASRTISQLTSFNKTYQFRDKTQASAKSKAFRWSQIKYTHSAEEKHPLFVQGRGTSDLDFSHVHGMIAIVQKVVLTHEFHENCQNYSPKIIPLPVFSGRCIRLRFSDVVWAAEGNKGSLVVFIICRYY